MKLKNLGLKLFSLGVAIALSIYVNRETNSSVIIRSVPIELTNLANNIVVVSPQSLRTRVTLRGPSYLVNRVSNRDISLKVPLPNEVGENLRVQLHGEDLDLPDPVEVVAIDPAEIELKFDRLDTREIPVVVPHIGALRSELRLESMEVDPRIVVVSGAAHDLAKLVKVESEPLDLSEIRESGQHDLAIRAPGSGLVVKDSKVRVAIQVTSVLSEQLLRQIPIEIRAKNFRDVAIEPNVVDISVSGPKKIIDKLNVAQVAPFVRLSDTVKDGEAISIDVELPAQVSAKEFKPERVKVRLKVKR